MKKLFLILFTSFLICTSALAADDSGSSDEWSDIGKMQDAWDGQKIITDEQFEKIIEQRTKKSKEKQEKKFKKKVGEAINPNNINETNLTTLRKLAENYPTLLVPKTIFVKNEVITPGFYRVLAAKTKKGKFFINFYQGSSLIGKIPAKETQNDYNAETINYAKIIYIENDLKAKIVYGCLDYNLVAETWTK